MRDDEHGSGPADQKEVELNSTIGESGVGDIVLADEACKRLAVCVAFIPALQFLHCICGSWERALYCAKHLARTTCALPYQEHLWTRGPGSNGKDTLANLMQCLLGGYFANLPCEALTGARGMDVPSQTLLSQSLLL